MPVKVTRNPRGGYRVSTPNGVKSRNTSKGKAEAQARLLDALEHGFEPDKNRARAKSRRRRTDPREFSENGVT